MKETPPYIENVMFGTPNGDKFYFHLFGSVSLLPIMTHFDFDIYLN
jgi:hypothetical protein